MADGEDHRGVDYVHIEEVTALGEIVPSPVVTQDELDREPSPERVHTDEDE